MDQTVEQKVETETARRGESTETTAAASVVEQRSNKTPFDKSLRATEPSDEILHEAWTESEIEEFKKMLEHQEKGKMTPYWLQKLEKDAVKYWNNFYKNNTNHFFKDRHYLHREIPEISQISNYCKERGLPSPVLLEVGSGVGNAIFPLIEDVPYLKVKTMDCSRYAVEEVLKKSPQYSPNWCEAHVCDIATQEFPFPPECADFATLIFVLSALTPATMPGVMSKIFKTLKPGGLLYLRDYAYYDMAMLRFGPGAKISDRFYKRGDGTRAYFFERKELETMAAEAGFVNITCEYRRRVVENRKEGLEMKRTWIQLKCYKPKEGTQSTDEAKEVQPILTPLDLAQQKSGCSGSARSSSTAAAAAAEKVQSAVESSSSSASASTDSQ